MGGARGLIRDEIDDLWVGRGCGVIDKRVPPLLWRPCLGHPFAVCAAWRHHLGQSSWDPLGGVRWGSMHPWGLHPFVTHPAWIPPAGIHPYRSPTRWCSTLLGPTHGPHRITIGRARELARQGHGLAKQGSKLARGYVSSIKGHMGEFFEQINRRAIGPASEQRVPCMLLEQVMYYFGLQK